MSDRNREVDERVVQMTFNNAEFERGVSHSLSTLEKLRRALDFKHRPTGLEDFGRAMGAVEQNMAPMAKNIDHIADRFSALGIIGDQVLRNLTNKVTAFGENIVKSATIEPLTSGFSEYETQMKSVQTILANTGMEGVKGVKRVNQALDELNEYADKTIYNFTEMTNNIGRFTAAGIDLDTSVNAIKGISNLAAMSGSTSEQNSRAMYNLSQALSSGTLKLMDWNSVVNAGMGGQVFQNQLIQAAAVLDGMGDKVDEWKKKNVDAFGGFRDSLSKGWITKDVLNEALSAFTYNVAEGTEEYTKALKELTSKGYTEKAAKDILKMGRQATEAATKVRTFTQLIDTLKEALGSGWAQSWRIIFGDFLEATELFTGISNLLGGIIDASSKARNEILSLWADSDIGGRREAIEAFKELVYDLVLILTPVKRAFDDVFGAFDVKKLQNLTVAFHNLAKSLHPSEQGFYAIQKIATTVFRILKSGLKIVGSGFSIALKLGRPLLYLADALLVAVSNLLDALANNTIIFETFDVLERIGRVISGVLILGIASIVKGVTALSNALRGLGLPKLDKRVKGVSRTTESFAKEVPLLNKAMEIFNKLTTGAKNGVEGFANALATGLTFVIRGIDYLTKLPIITTAVTGIKNILNSLGIILVGIAKTIGSIFHGIGNIDLKNIANPLELIKQVVTTVVNNVVNGFKNIVATLESKSTIFKSFVGMINSVITAFKNGVGVIKEFFSTLKNNGFNFEGGSAGIRSLKDALVEFTSVVTPAKAAALAITMVLLAMSLTFMKVGTQVATTLKSVSGLFNTATKVINGFINVQANKIIQAAEAVLMVAAAIAIVAGIPDDELLRATAAIGALSLIMGILAIVYAKFQKFPSIAGGDTTNNIINLGGLALMVLELAASLGLLDMALIQLKEVNLEAIMNNLGAVLGILASFIAISFILDKGKVGFSKGTIGVLVLSTALLVMTNAIKQLKEVDPETALNSILGLIPLLAALTVIGYAVKGIGVTTGLGLILTAKAIEYLMPQIQLLYDTLKTKIPLILALVEEYQNATVILGVLALGVIAISSILGKGFQSLGIGFAAIAAGIYILSMAFQKLAEITNTEQDLTDAAALIVGMMAFVSIWVLLAAFIPEKSAILRVGAAIILMASSLVIMNLALAQIVSMSAEPGIKIAAIILGGMLLALSLMMKIASKAAAVKGAFELMGAMMAGLTVLTAELIALSFIKPKDLIVPIIALGTLLFAMGNILKSMQNISKFKWENVFAVGIIVLGIGGICSALGYLATFNWTSLLGAAVSMGIVFLALNKVVNSFAKLNNFASANAAIPIMGACLVALGVVAYVLSELAQYHWTDLLGNAIILSGVMLALTAVVAIISKVTSNLASGVTGLTLMIGVAIALYSVALTLTMLSQIDTAKMWESLKVAGLSMLGITALIAIFSKIGPAALEGAVVGALSIGLFVSMIVAELMIFGSILSSLDVDGTLFDPLNYLAEKFGTVVGKFVNSFGVAATESLPLIGEKLGQFGENAKPFFDAAASIDETKTNGVLNLVKAIGAITGAGFWESIKSAITQKDSFDQFNEAMPKLAQGIRSYAETINALDDKDQKVDYSGLEDSVNALVAIAGAAKDIPNSGGKIGKVFGENDPKAFADQLGALAAGIKAFAEGVIGVDYSGVEDALDTLRKIATTAKEIPNAGGKIAEMIGDNEIDVFAGKLPALADGLKTFAEKVSVITNEQWGGSERAMRAFKNIVNVADDIPNSGGAIAAIFGDNDINKFGGSLGALGNGLRTFATLTGSVSEAQWSSAERSMDTLKKIAEVAEAIPNSGISIASLFVGDNTLDKFGKQLSAFADTFGIFADRVRMIRTEDIDKVGTSIGTFVNAIKGIGDIKISKIQHVLPLLEKELGNIVDALNKSIDENKDDVTKMIDKVIDMLLAKIKEHNKDFRDRGKEIARSMGDGIQVSSTNLGDNIVTLVKNAFENSRDELIKMANEMGAEIGNEYVNGIIGPEGIDPDVHVDSQDASHKIEEPVESLTTNAFNEAGNNIMDTVKKGANYIGDLWSDTVANGINPTAITDKLSSVADYGKKLWNGEITPTDVWNSITGAADEIMSGSGLAKILGIGNLFEGMDGNFDLGSDIEKNLKSALSGASLDTDSLTKSTGKLGKSVSGTTDKLTKAKDNLKIYTTYLKYSTKVQDEFAKTFGAAMSIGNEVAPIDNAKVAVAALAEKIYSDAQNVKDTVDDTATTIEDRAAAVMDAFNKDYESIKSSVGDSIDLFKNFYEETSEKTKPNTLLQNAQSQLDGYESLITKYNLLALKGVPVDYIQELASKGADAREMIDSILDLDTPQLDRFIKLREETDNLGDTFASKIMVSKAIAISVKDLKKQAAGQKAVNKELIDMYSIYKKFYKEVVDNGGNPAEDERLIKFFKGLSEYAGKANLTMEDLENSLNNVAGANAAVTMQLIRDYTDASSVLDKYNTTLAETSNSMAALIEDQLGGFDEFTKKTGISSEKMLSNLRSQVKGLNQWSKELGSLAARGLSDDIINKLAELGPQGYEQVHAFYKMTEEQITEANDLWGRKAGLTQTVSKTIGTKMAESAVGGAKAYTDALEKYSETSEEFQKAIETFSSNITTGVTEKTSADLIMGGADAGKAFTQSMAKAIDDNKEESTSSAKSAAKESTDEAAKTVKEEGNKTIEPAVDGVVKDTAKEAAKTIGEESDKTVEPAAKESAKDITGKFGEELNYKNGVEISRNWLKGIEDPLKKDSPEMQKLKDIAMESAGVLPTTFRFVTKEHSPSKESEDIGHNWNLGLIKGIEKDMSLTASRARKAAMLTVNATKETLEQLDSGALKLDDIEIKPKLLVENEDMVKFRDLYSRNLDKIDKSNKLEDILGDPFWNKPVLELVRNLAIVYDQYSSLGSETDQILRGGDQAAIMAESARKTAYYAQVMQGNGENAIEHYNNRMRQKQLEVAEETKKAIEAANALADVESLNPVITPVVDLSAAQNGFNTLGTMFDSDSFRLRLTHPIQNQISVNNDMNKVAGAINNSRYDDSKLREDISGLREDVNILNTRIGELQVVMDTGTLVGTIAPKMDRELGNIYRRNNR